MAKKNEKRHIEAYLAKIGSKGGKTTAEKLTKEQLVERARKAVAAREAKKGEELAMAKKKIDAARTNPVASDFRKESETYQFLMNGRSPIEEIEDFVSILQRDHVRGFINDDDVKNYIAFFNADIDNRLAPIKARIANMKKTAREAKKGGK